MVRDAESHAEDDRKRREEAEVRNQADSLVYQTEKMLKDQASSFSGGEKERVEGDLKLLKDALSGGDIEGIRRTTETLASGVQELGKKLYESAAASAGSSPTGGADGGPQDGANDDEVVDAEIVDEHGQSA
jgi:molecular chaperone DnaK